MKSKKPGKRERFGLRRYFLLKSRIPRFREKVNKRVYGTFTNVPQIFLIPQKFGNAKVMIETQKALGRDASAFCSLRPGRRSDFS
jgi:hypothetical protein